MKLKEEVKDFFISYEVANTIFDKKNIKVEIFEAKSRNVLQVRLMEVGRSSNFSRSLTNNMFCDVKVEGIKITMMFKCAYPKMQKKFNELVNKLKKSDYKINFFGNQVNISIIDPRLDEISNLFVELEPYCRKFKQEELL